MDKLKIILSAVGIHISIGSVYAWSVLTLPIMLTLGCTLTEVQFAFSIAILFLGLSAGFLGKYVEKIGPKNSGLLSTFLFLLGLSGTSMAIYLHSLPLLYLFYGVIGGTGIGIGYITPVSTLIKTFPNNKGLAGGIAIMGFGIASLIAAPVMQIFIQSMPIFLVPLILGLIYFIIMFISSFGFSNVKTNNNYSENITNGMTLNEAKVTKNFLYLWLILFLNIFCGIAIISVASPLSQEILGILPDAAAIIVGVIGLMNGLGRIIWPYISDYMSRKDIYTGIFIVQIICFLIMLAPINVVLFKICLYTVITCYGAGFALMPSYLSDVFGNKELGAIHGRVLTAWAAAGLLAPLFIAFIKSFFGVYLFSLIAFVLLLIIACYISTLIKVNK